MAAIPTKSWACMSFSHLSPLTPWNYIGDKGQCCCAKKSQPECSQNCTQNWATAAVEPSDCHCLHLCENDPASSLEQAQIAGDKKNIFLLIFIFNAQELRAACRRSEFPVSATWESIEANMFYWLFWLWVWRIGSIPSDICHLKLQQSAN